VTGHTGFQGAWLTLWLTTLEARVSGFAREPDANPSVFFQCELADVIDHRSGDIRAVRGIAERIAPTFGRRSSSTSGSTSACRSRPTICSAQRRFFIREPFPASAGCG
jgi:nucleoside-diphosphate-sugar epimerase